MSRQSREPGKRAGREVLTGNGFEGEGMASSRGPEFPKGEEFSDDAPFASAGDGFRHLFAAACPAS